jgi:tRNA G18 (ribose-2'-O)-methylase SpoU
MHLIPVETLADPRLAPYANMRDAELAQRADPLDAAAHGGLFIAEGELVLRRLIASRFAVQSVLTTATRLDSLREALAPLPEGTPVFLADQPTMNQIVGFNMHRGVLAIGVRGAGLGLATLAARPGPLVILEDLTNHDNLGGVFRNAAALGGAGVGVLLSPRCADPLYRKSIRVSMGAALCVPFARLTDWPASLGQITAAGFRVWGFTPREGAVAIGEACQEAVLARSRVAVLLGSEGPGLTDDAIAACTRLVRIPMHKADPAIDSLNVAMSCGIGLHCLGDSIRTNV